MLCAAGWTPCQVPRPTTVAAPAPAVEPPKAVPVWPSGLLTCSTSRQNTERMSPAPKHVQRSSREAAELLFGHHQGDAEGQGGCFKDASPSQRVICCTKASIMQRLVSQMERWHFYPAGHSTAWGQARQGFAAQRERGIVTCN